MLLEFDYVLHTDFFRMGMTEETNSNLGASTQALTKTINNSGITACVVVVCHNKL